MKTIFLSVILALITNLSVGQVSDSSAQAFTKADYLKKSSNQNKGAWALAIGGSILNITAIVIEAGSGFAWNATQEEQDKSERNEKTAKVLFVVGTTSIIGSIPLFIASHKNHKKSMQVAIGTVPVQQLRSNNIYTNISTALMVKLNW